jgi:hypothetical protein
MILRSCSRHALFALTLLCAVPTTASADLNITEFLAKNADVITDEDGDYSDYIELFNSGPSAVDLDGYYLTDDSGALTKFRLPAVTLDADDFLLVFASGKNRAVPDRSCTAISLSPVPVITLLLWSLMERRWFRISVRVYRSSSKTLPTA